MTPTEKAEKYATCAASSPGEFYICPARETAYLAGHTEGRREALEMAQGLVEALRTACEELNLAEGRFEEDIAPRAVHLYKEQAREGVEELRLALTRFEAWRDGK